MGGPDRCAVCRQDLTWHKENEPRHPFTPEGTQISLEMPEPEVQHVPASYSGDLVLRLTLMKLGLITEKDLSHTRHMVELASQQKKSLVVVADSESRTGFKLSLMSLEDMLAQES